MPKTATMWQMIQLPFLKIPKKRDDKQSFNLLKFQTASENFDSDKGNDNNRVSICNWHYNHKDRILNSSLQMQGESTNVLLLHPIFPPLVRTHEQKYV